MTILLAALTLFFSALLSAAPLTNIIVFGDSLSDNGNLYEYMKHHLPQSPPYYKGRFTNGPVWVEWLALNYFKSNLKDKLLDYAYGGAAVLENPTDNEDEAFLSLEHEIDTYLISNHDIANPNSLYIIWIGANNYLSMPEEPQATIIKVNQGIKQALERLIKAGAKHFLILNLPDLGKTPAAHELGEEAQLSSLAINHNEVLNQTITNLKTTYPQIQWLYFDIFKGINDVLEQPEAYGFNNIIGACNEFSLFGKPSKRAILKMASKLTKQVTTCDGYLFFDAVHPSAAAHELIARRVYDLLNKAKVQFSA